MKKILVIPGSNSHKSINKAFALWAASQLDGHEIKAVDINEFEMPLYSPLREEESGVPQKAKDFASLIQGADGVILSLAEHNGSYTAGFKNLLDWGSRAESKLWSNKPILILSTSPGARGGASVRAAAESYFPFMGAKVTAGFSLPKFNDNFSSDDGISDPELDKKFLQALDKFKQQLG